MIQSFTAVAAKATQSGCYLKYFQIAFVFAIHLILSNVPHNLLEYPNKYKPTYTEKLHSSTAVDAEASQF